jgi:hypothetical protein
LRIRWRAGLPKSWHGRRFGGSSRWGCWLWAQVEADVETAVTSEFLGNFFHVTPQVELKINYLLSSDFSKKLVLLKKLGRAKPKDYRVLVNFSERRNKLFHGRPFKPWVTNLSNDEKQELMKLAWEAIDASTEVAVPNWKQRLKEMESSNRKVTAEKSEAND